MRRGHIAVLTAPFAWPYGDDEMQAQLALAVLNTIRIQAAVIDPAGVIVGVNNAWRIFGAENSPPGTTVQWEGVRYLDACTPSDHSGDPTIGMASAGIESVLSGRRKEYNLEYPCHSPNEQRWFLMRVFALPEHGPYPGHVLITHENMTELLLAQARTGADAPPANSAPLDGPSPLARRWSLLWSSALSRRDALNIVLVDRKEGQVTERMTGKNSAPEAFQALEASIRSESRRLGAFIAAYDSRGLLVLPRTTSPNHSRELELRIRQVMAQAQEQRNLMEHLGPGETWAVRSLQIYPSDQAEPEAALHEQIALAREDFQQTVIPSRC